MLENEISTQSEKRGRFIIQEIEEEQDQNLKNNYCSEKFLNLNVCMNPMNNSKRPRHSSIMDSKIIHTTRTDSNFSHIMFTTLVYDENRKDWVDFDQTWKEFSKVHCDVLEDDMEKIFHYIDKKIDESDFFYLSHTASQSQSNLLIKSKNDDKFKLTSDYDIQVDIADCKNVLPYRVKSEEVYGQKLNSNSSVNKQELQMVGNKDNLNDQQTNEGKFSVQINFCGPSIISPAISPINSSTKLIKFDFTNEELPSNYRNRYITKSECKKPNKKKEIKENYNKNFKVYKNIQFSILPTKKEKVKNNMQIHFQQFQISTTDRVEIQNSSHRKNGSDNICSICYNIITDK